MTFTIYPAIDLRKGQVVRLQHGDPQQQTTFSNDPLAIAQQWIAAGATWLHVVNLDGAFDEAGRANWQVLAELTKLAVKVQFGGGIRSFKDVALAINRGVSRVVLGTVAIEEPEIVEVAVRQFGPERIAVGIDARNGRVKTRGWLTDTAVTPADLAFHMTALGVQTIIYTDINRDGILSGVNAPATVELAQESGLEVIASGGVASLEDVRQLRPYAAEGISGVIIGRALYEGKIDLREAITLANG